MRGERVEKWEEEKKKKKGSKGGKKRRGKGTEKGENEIMRKYVCTQSTCTHRCRFSYIHVRTYRDGGWKGGG